LRLYIFYLIILTARSHCHPLSLHDALPIYLQPPLADFGLIGGVGRVPGGILEQVALDHRRDMDAVIAGADEALQYRVARHDGGQDRKSTRLNSSHVKNSYAVFCL